ncbi:MAG: hypothetical protein GXO42_02545 [bacterium]|nr:hypothetical protein [bacterium]
MLDKLLRVIVLASSQLNTKIEVLENEPMQKYYIVAPAISWPNRLGKLDEEFERKFAERFAASIEKQLREGWKQARVTKLELASNIFKKEQAAFLRLLLNLHALDLLKETVLLEDEQRRCVRKELDRIVFAIYRCVEKRLELKNVDKQAAEQFLQELQELLKDPASKKCLEDGITLNLALAILLLDVLRLLGKADNSKIIIEPRIVKELRKEELEQLARLFDLGKLKIFSSVGEDFARIEAVGDLALLEKNGKHYMLRAIIEVKRIRKWERLQQLLEGNGHEGITEPVAANLLKLLAAGLLIKYIIIIYVIFRINYCNRRKIAETVKSGVLEKLRAALFLAAPAALFLVLELAKRLLEVEVVIPSKQVIKHSFVRLQL